MKPAQGLAPDEPGRVLASGVDSLSLAVSLRWPDDEAFARFAELKQAAKERTDDEPLTVVIGDGADAARFVVKPHGGGGFEWLLASRELSIALGNWKEPKQRPSAMVDLRSETLWAHGATAGVQRVASLFDAMGADVEAMKPSRLDLCVDVLLREADWRPDLDQHFVTRARGTSTHRKNGDLSGFSIGKGAASARLYDKPREIREQSHKVWMFDIWRLPGAPEGHRIVRVEFQLRRDVLRETKLHSWEGVQDKLLRIWAYCTQRWLRLAVDAALYHTQQEVLPWWSVVQDGFKGAQQACPLVREAAINVDKRQLWRQTVGTLTSSAALNMRDQDSAPTTTLDRASFLRRALEEAIVNVGIDDEEFTRRVERKRAKYARSGPGFGKADATPPRRAVESAGEPEEAPE